MTPEELQTVIRKYWTGTYKHNPLKNSGEAPVVFRDPVKDTFLHHLKVDYGVVLDVDVTTAASRLRSYEIVDGKKYMMFLLEWS